ncbi:VOC family protein [Dyella sp. C11]|uniref:bleomycin resistance protein n=1 Tax=Dyella sp. C11 TaxID=2126991 RepID=UPI0013001ED9|nr:VOC family protein [Dyella sp. C11]
MSEITATTFVLAVNSLATSVRFYTEQLGFEETLREDGWSFLQRGACHLRIGDCPDAQPMTACQDHSWFAYLHVRDIGDLFREYLSRNVEIWHPLEDKPWGMREFAIVTPDGHRIVFGEQIV